MRLVTIDPTPFAAGVYDAQSFAGGLELFVLQPTSFCNLNCDYCYLPGRSTRKTMETDTLRKAFRCLFNSMFVGRSLSVVWHSGEPLSVPVSFYESALEIIGGLNENCVAIEHHVQTNATLINKQWCEFFLRNDFKVGVSLDGPRFLHDMHRRRRSGRGTFDDVIRGIRRLQEYAIDFSAICVITRASLDFADEIFAFFEDLGVQSVGLNIEELEGAHKCTSITAGSEKALSLFAKKLTSNWLRSSRRYPIREIDRLVGIVSAWDQGPKVAPQESAPFRIISVDADGNFSTFSPELLSHREFWLGNVSSDSFDDAANSKRFQVLYDSIRAGIKKCKETCDFFCICGGGSPANKFFESGTFACTETRHCINTVQVCADAVISILETECEICERRLDTRSCTCSADISSPSQDGSAA